MYEGNALENMVKVTNLPTTLKNDAPVTISIYTVGGTLVRTLTKGDKETTYVNWDLKNSYNIPIASGVYIIHVNCPGIGERMLKFFCTMRQTDLNTF
jgi:flagellar hook assembly protein FlgD